MVVGEKESDAAPQRIEREGLMQANPFETLTSKPSQLAHYWPVGRVNAPDLSKRSQLWAIAPTGVEHTG